MNITERKSTEQILDLLDGVEKVFIVSCQGCPLGCETGGQPWIDEMNAALTGAGKKVVGAALIDMICNKAVVGSRLRRQASAVSDADAVLVGSCGVGVQAVGNMVGRLAVPAMDTVCMGAYQGLGPSQERCAECGECMLALTGGLCPVTLCAKSLINGQCGGTQDDGACEVTSSRRCGWQMIYERLEQLGRLDDLKQFHAPKDYRKREITDSRRAGIYWALEVSEQEEEAEALAAEK